MKYQGGSSQNYYNYLEVQLANASYDPNNYFESSMSSHVDVTGHSDTRYVASADSFNYGYYGQEPMSIVNSSSFDATSNMRHVNPNSSAISSQYVISP